MKNVAKEIKQNEDGTWTTTFEGDSWISSATAPISGQATELALSKLEDSGAPANIADRLRDLAQRQFDRENYKTMSKCERDAHNNL